MTSKHIHQIVSKEGKAIAPATSAPGWFIHDGVPLQKHPDISWGQPFAEPCNGNKVDFYVTGEEYFTAVADAIRKARKSIYIAGWQVNFDVELIKGKSLLQCLLEAIDGNADLRVFVMPWLSPKVGVNTGDFETMLAIFQLNAGLPAPRAYALPAIAQSDMPGTLGIGFSHHQKLVVIDDRQAFVGGIDLAYGRRDDGKFSLAANGRVGNELYNPCIPPIHELSNTEQTNFLTRAELLAACFDGTLASGMTFATSAPARPVAAVQDVVKIAADSAKTAHKVVTDWWETVDLVPEFVRKMQDVPVDAAQEVSRWAYQRLDKELRGKLDRLRQTGSAHAANASAVLLAWLNNASMDQLPAELRLSSIQLIEAFTIATLVHLNHSAHRRKERYPNIQKLGKMVPANGKVISSAQPRMPWHDVHSSVIGPAVSDLSRNFVSRWNGIAHRYEKSYVRSTAGPTVAALFGAFGVRPNAIVRIPRLAAPPRRTSQLKAGKSWVQVLRSAPAAMRLDEKKAEQLAVSGDANHQPENNCLKAMLTAIHSAQKFLYIEGQFFQSACGFNSGTETSAAPSGPMQALTDISASPAYETHAKRLGIYGATPERLFSQIRWSQIDDVRREPGGAEFVNDLNVVLGNIAAIETSKLMGKSQERLINPVGQAIAKRIEAAVFDGLPFHVYMVLPVHPEGTLDTLNIMTQVHLTMQSLIFGSESLVNRVRRAILSAKLVKKEGVSRKNAMEKVAGYGLERVIDEAEDLWKEYLTLLNLRNWQTLVKRPVTEQVYVHSKLLIADDRVAIIGSANINDRSQLGDRDSELAIIVRDDEQITAKLDGMHEDHVSQNVHGLRVRLWQKLFGLGGSATPAVALAHLIVMPAAPATWQAIQRVATANAIAYKKAFPHLPSVDGEPSSIWPLWHDGLKRLRHHMPFNERFWRQPEVLDTAHSWEAKSRVAERTPEGIQGFVVALPESWTARENNISGLNLTMLAQDHRQIDENRSIASVNNDTGIFAKG